MFTIFIAAISDFTDNATVFHDKRPLLDLVTGTGMLRHVDCRVAMRSGLFWSLLLPLLGFCATIALPNSKLSHHHVQHHQHLPQPKDVTEGSVGCPGSISRLVCLVPPHNEGHTMSLNGERDESSSARCILALYRVVHHTLNTLTSFFFRIDCVFCPGSEWSLQQHQMQLYCFGADKGRWTTLPFIVRAIKCGFEKYASRLL